MRKQIKAVLSSSWGTKILTRAERYKYPRALLTRLSYPRIAFENFDKAWEAAGHDRYAGHETESIDVHLGLMEKLRQSDPHVLRHLSSIALRKHLSVLDFGGNVGNVYYCYRPHLPADCQLDWVVVDLRAVTSVGSRVAREKNTTELRFANSLEEVSGNFDVLLASGSLHYWEGSISSWLGSLSSFPPHVIVNRSPVHETHPTFITVQQTKTYAVPCIVRNRAELIGDFSQRGYSLIDAWSGPELSLTITLFPGLSVPSYSGFCFRRSDLK